jgi:DMSO/TMAO reductase YedYZ molybdopterin-dependent catalytic subunit
MRETHESRRQFLLTAAAGTAVAALGGWYFLGDLLDPAYAESRDDGKPRVPPGQRTIGSLKDMGGEEGDGTTSGWTLQVHGEVSDPFELDWKGLKAMEQTTQLADVHCVTGWTCLDVEWKGVLLSAIAARAGVTDAARHVIFEAAHGYTANVPLAEAMRPNVMLAHRMNGKSLPKEHGKPVRILVPDLYFWKSAKWLTGIRFAAEDDPGYWERRGYHNHGDPWKEERYG